MKYELIGFATVLLLARFYFAFTVGAGEVTGMDVYKTVAHLFVASTITAWCYTRKPWLLWVSGILIAAELIAQVITRLL